MIATAIAYNDRNNIYKALIVVRIGTSLTA